MADVIGPSSYLPGRVLKAAPGAVCDEHEDRPSAGRVVGETDSFGSEIIDCCQECLDAHVAAQNQPNFNAGICDLCRQEVDERRPTRDPEESMCGPVYYACQACRRKLHTPSEEEKQLIEDTADIDEDYYPDDDWPLPF